MPQSAKLLLKFDPDSDLPFKGPYGQPSISILKMKSISNRIVAFKIKTTAPKCYTVVPTHGYIAPDHQISVQLTFNGSESDIRSRIKHKFLVQTIIAPDDVETLSPVRFWKEVNLQEAMIYEHKLCCLFEEEQTEKISTEKTQRATFKSILDNADDSNKERSKESQSQGSVLSSQSSFLVRKCKEHLGKLQNTNTYLILAGMFAAFCAAMTFYYKKPKKSSPEVNEQTNLANNGTIVPDSTISEKRCPLQVQNKNNVLYVLAVLFAILSAILYYWLKMVKKS